MITKDSSIPRKPTHRITMWCATIFCKSSCKVVTKDHSIPENQHLRIDTIFCNHLAKLLQKIIASQENPTHRITCATIFCKSSCKVVTKDHSIPENPTHRITCATIFCKSSCKVVTKDHSIPEKPTHQNGYYLL